MVSYGHLASASASFIDMSYPQQLYIHAAAERSVPRGPPREPPNSVCRSQFLHPQRLSMVLRVRCSVEISECTIVNSPRAHEDPPDLFKLCLLE